MIILAAYFILMCNPVDQKQCVQIGEAQFETEAECQAKIEEMTRFWQLHVGEEPPMPLKCGDDEEHT